MALQFFTVCSYTMSDIDSDVSAVLVVLLVLFYTRAIYTLLLLFRCLLKDGTHVRDKYTCSIHDLKLGGGIL